MAHRAQFAIRGTSIELQQLLKAHGVAENGGAAKELIQGGRILVNGKLERRRSKKLVPGDIVQWVGGSVVIEAESTGSGE